MAVLCGLALTAAGFLKILLVDNALMHSGVTYSEMAVVCITLAVTVFCAKLVGCTLPILAKRLGLDPAVMASPFITTIIDAVSLVVYFTVATHILSI